MTRTILLSICVLFPARFLMAAENRGAAERSIVNSLANTKSLEVHTNTVRSADPVGHGSLVIAENMYAFVRKDGRLLYRSEISTRNTPTSADGGASQTSRTLIINDGKFVYSLSEGPQGTSATRSMANANLSYVVDDGYFERMGKQYSVELLPDESIDGKPQYVFECIPRKAPAGEIGKLRLYFDKATGVTTKTVGFDSNNGRAIVTTAVTEVRTNPSLPDDFFAFKAPEGIEITDLSGGSEKSSTAKPAAEPGNEPTKKP